MSQYVTTPDGKRHSFPDEASPEQIKAALSSYVGPASAPADATGTADPYQSAGIRIRALEMLPTAGGFVGGVLGAFGGVPGSIGGAAAGGAIGEGLREGARGEQLSPGKIALGGVEQGAYQAVGGALAKGAGMAARPVMRRALGVGKTVLSNFPDAVETTLKKGIPVSGSGVAKATALRQESSAKLTAMLNEAKLGGKRIKVSDITAEARKLLSSKVIPNEELSSVARLIDGFERKYGKKAAKEVETKVLDQFGNKIKQVIAAKKPRDLSPPLTNRVKQLHQNRASTLFKAERQGAMTEATSSNRLFSQAIARGAKRELEKIPGVAARNRETQSLIGAERAVKDAAMKAPKPFEIHKPGTYPIINNPQVTSRLAITMADPQFQAMLRQSPRAAAELLQQMMLSAESDATAVGQ